MSENIQRTGGLSSNYRFDRGGVPAQFGPYIGLVKNNIDPTRSGRLQVYIEQFSGSNPSDSSLWITVSLISPFYGTTKHVGTSTGVGTFIGNQQSYGMWFTPPDLDTQVICFFVAGDPNQGYYLGCVLDPGINHMVPAIGASKNFNLENEEQKTYYSKVTQLPVTEINDLNRAIDKNPRFFDEKKPVHSVVAGMFFQQGLIKDTIRGPITSSSQRESPSSVYGISTPGRPIYSSGVTDEDIEQKLNADQLKPTDVRIVGRRGGHSLVMDDGNIEGVDNCIRLRTSKGHQITMSDDGDCFYIIHANGQSWIELGAEGTVDVYSSNSVNIRTQGELNLHADKNINMFATESINIKSNKIAIEAKDAFTLIGTNNLTLYSKAAVAVKSDGSLTLQNKDDGGWNGGQALIFKANSIDLNGPSPSSVDKPTGLADYKLPDTVFKVDVGWESENSKLTTIVTRAPTHEPFSLHNKGISLGEE